MRQVNKAEYTNKNGEFFHPDIPKDFDYWRMQGWGHDNNVVVKSCLMESNCQDEDLLHAVFEKGSTDISKWKPAMPEGFTLLAKFHDEDGNGPYAYFGKKMEDETYQS